MQSLVFAALTFIAIHVAIPGTAVRQVAIRGVGEAVYRLLFAILSLGVFVWLIGAYIEAERIYLEVWLPLTVARPLAGIAMVLAVLLGVAGLTAGRGGPDSGAEGEPARGIFRVTRRPVLMAVQLWAIAHFLVRGEAGFLVLFGAFAVLVALGSGQVDRRQAGKAGAAWPAYAAATSVLPFAAIAAGRNRLVPGEIGWRRAALAAAVYMILLLAHEFILGVPARLS